MSFLRFAWQYKAFRYVVYFNIILNLTPFVFASNPSAKTQNLNTYADVCGGQTLQARSSSEDTQILDCPLFAVGAFSPEKTQKTPTRLAILPSQKHKEFRTKLSKQKHLAFNKVYYGFTPARAPPQKT